MASRRKRRWTFVMLVVGVVLVSLYWVTTSTQRQLSRIGYSKEEIGVLTSKLRRSEMQPILENEYLSEMIQMLAERDVPEDFRVEKLGNYIQIQQKYGFTPELTVKLVNHPDYDLNEEYTVEKTEILYDDYYLTRNLSRYMDFQEKTKESEPANTVALVNANRDRDYYTKTEEAMGRWGDLLLVNKYYYLEHDFAVELVEQAAGYGSAGEKMEVETYAAFERMFRAAQADGYQLYVTSGYRGYEEQEEVFESYLLEGGEEYAMKYAAKPGYSEHQTGRAIDIFTPGETINSFADSPVATWLEEHADEYGFILRYPKGKEELTGYSYEPWHYRYVGREIAQEIKERDITLEEYAAVFGD